MTKGERIKTLRLESHMTMEELGRQIGVGKATIKKYEDNTINIPSDKAEMLAEVFNTTPSYIYCWSDERRPIQFTDEDEKEIYERIIKNRAEREILKAYDALSEEGHRQVLDYILFLQSREQK